MYWNTLVGQQMAVCQEVYTVDSCVCTGNSSFYFDFVLRQVLTHCKLPHLPSSWKISSLKMQHAFLKDLFMFEWYIYIYLVLVEVRRGAIPWTGAIDGCELPYGCWELNRSSGRALNSWAIFPAHNMFSCQVCLLYRLWILFQDINQGWVMSTRASPVTRTLLIGRSSLSLGTFAVHHIVRSEARMSIFNSQFPTWSK